MSGVEMRLVASGAVTEAVALALTAAIGYLCGLAQLGELAALFVASNVTVISIRMMLKSNAESYSENARRSSFTEYLHRVLYRNRSGHSYAKASYAAAAEIQNAELREQVLSSVRKRMMLFEADGEEGAARDRANAEAEIRRRARETETRQADVDEKAQRNATLNMFVSTVLPSFMVFAFIGGSILSHEYFSLVALSACLILAIPVIYSAGSLVMWRRLFA
ncbi:MAG: hypothetical protein M1286_04205 [Candidatus Marsarchaeota archaeon]|nr:hypothetical protein [Candidatus Marsarchaeota archaeon]